MRETLTLLAEISNNIHDILVLISQRMGFNLTDKDLHFWVIGFIGIITFSFVLFVFQAISKLRWNVHIFSFIYTFTVMIVLVFAIEIQQGITNRGRMEFEDALVSLWGFVVFLSVYPIVGISYYYVKQYYKNKRRKRELDS
jgi:hypothetical protein